MLPPDSPTPGQTVNFYRAGGSPREARTAAVTGVEHSAATGIVLLDLAIGDNTASAVMSLAAWTAAGSPNNVAYWDIAR